MRNVGLAAGLGFISSSCSFAALTATRALWTKGARLESALAFMLASTNLVIELGVLLWIVLGWEFVLALYLGAGILIPVMVILVRLTCPKRLAEEARRRAKEAEGEAMDPADGLDASWRERVRDLRAWGRVGDRFVMEWQMAGKEILVGFLVAGGNAALVPREAFEAVFPPASGPSGSKRSCTRSSRPWRPHSPSSARWETVPGIMAFFAADFVVPPSLKVNANYYGWRFSLYLAAVFTTAAVVSGVVPHSVFAVAGLTPQRNVTLAEQANLELNHTFFLNVVAVTVAAVLLALRRWKPEGAQRYEDAQDGYAQPMARYKVNYDGLTRAR